MFVAIDKLDKIGAEKVKEELRTRGFAEEGLSILFEILTFKGTTQQKIEFLKTRFASSEKGKKGITDFTEVLALLNGYRASEDHVEFDIALARGLSYYTGVLVGVVVGGTGVAVGVQVGVFVGVGVSVGVLVGVFVGVGVRVGHVVVLHVCAGRG